MLLQRTLAALVFAPPLLAVVWFGGLPLLAALCLIIALSLWEFLRLTLGGAWGVHQGLAYLLTAALAATVMGAMPALCVPILLPMATVALLVVSVLHPHPMQDALKRAGLTALGVLYAGGLLPYLFLLRELPTIGLGVGIMALFCTWGADTGAYFSGRALGRHKLYVALSPGKTVEGLMGGLLSAVAVAFLIRWLFDVPLSAPHVVALGFLAGAFGALGDLAESLLKRSVGAKDSSNLIPGHGGILDRFDAVIFVAPVLYAYATLFI